MSWSLRLTTGDITITGWIRDMAFSVIHCPFFLALMSMCVCVLVFWDLISCQKCLPAWTRDPGSLNPTGAGTGIVWGSQVNTIAADALPPYITRTSSAMILKIQDKLIHIFHKEGLQLPAPSQWWVIKENVNMFLCLLEISSTQQGLTYWPLLTSLWSFLDKTMSSNGCNTYLFPMQYW